MKRDYGLLHAHSEFSNIKIIDSINRYETSINYAWELGLSTVAMTEHDCLSGSLKYVRAFKKKVQQEWQALHPDEEMISYNEMVKELDFKPILGNEIYLSEEGLNKDSDFPGHFWHLILLAKDEEGFKQIKRLSSAAWLRSWSKSILRTPTYPSDLISIVNGGHIVATTACLGGYTAWCWKMMPEGPEIYKEKLDNHLAAMENLFGKGNFYIELQPNEGVYGKEQNDYNKFMIENYWGQYPFIFSTDAHYLNAAERDLHKAFLNSKSSKDREVDSFYRYAYIMSQAEVKSLMDYISDDMFMEMVNNTKHIIDMCEVYDLEQPKKIAYIEYEHFDEYADDLLIFNDIEKEDFPNLYYYLFESDKQADLYLGRLIAHGFANKCNSNWNILEYYKRLEEECWTLKAISDNIHEPMSDYFVTVSKIVDLMWEAGSLVGPSRGSAGAFLINYLLDITQMDPIQLNLPFVWRFLHPSRPDFPDYLAS